MLKSFMTIILIIIISILITFSMINSTSKSNQVEGDIENLQEIVITELDASFDYRARAEFGASRIDKEKFERNLIERISRLKGASISGESPEIKIEYAEDMDSTIKSLSAIHVSVKNIKGETYNASYEFDVSTATGYGHWLYMLSCIVLIN